MKYGGVVKKREREREKKKVKGFTELNALEKHLPTIQKRNN